MRFLFTIGLTIFLSTTVFGTAQAADRIIYNGKTYRLFTNPLESYFEKYPDKRPAGEVWSTALWRGYIATFEIKDNQLYIKKIEVEVFLDTIDYKRIWKNVLNEVFPNQELVKIDWFTGLLVLPYGKLVNYVHMGYGSTYKHYILLEIDKGVLKQQKQFNYKKYEKFKKKQFQAFKKTEEYEKTIIELEKSDRFENKQQIDAFLKNFILENTSKILVE